MARIINIIHQPHLTTYRAYDDSKHRCCTVCEYKIFIEKDNGEIVIASELEDCSLMGFNAEGFIKELSKEEKDADLYTPFTSAVGKEELEEFLNGEVEEKGGEVLHSVHNVLRTLRESHCVIAHDALDSLQELKAELDKTIEETKKAMKGERTMMTEKEKAKAYDEAIEYAKYLLGNCPSDSEENKLKRMFPELKESKDERTRKTLIKHFEEKLQNGYEWAGIPVNSILAWLEKQGEHKKFRDGIQVGDQVTRNEDGELVNLSQLKRVAKQGEQKPDEFNDTNAKRMFIKALERVEEQNSKGYKLTDCDKNSWWEDFKAYTSCIIEKKSAWSEKDEREVAVLEAYIRSKDWSDSHIGRALGIVDELVKKLKSLRPQKQWKPSELELASLGMLIEHPDRMTNYNIENLKSLYEQLKAL